MNRPAVLIPFDRREAISLNEAAEIANRSVETLRRWVATDDLGRKIGGQWMVSRVALAMFLDADREALRAYLRGDRQSPSVRAYFEREILGSRV